ncbi:MAG: ABC transporter permease [bacterium]
MKIFILKRILAAIPLLIGITALSFVIMKLAPGDPTLIYTDPSVSLEDLKQVQQNLGLDKPVLHQYMYWLKNMFQGNLGYSYLSHKPVIVAMTERLPATLLLATVSLVVILALTLPLGLISGQKKDTLFDHSVTFFTFLGMSMPTFWLGLMLILALSLYWPLFPSSGFIDLSLSQAPWPQKIASILWHMALPLVTMVLGGLAALTRYHRFGIIGTLKQDYITAGRGRGLSEKRLLYKHAFKNASLPLVTILGLELPGLISGSFVIEYIFAWPGLGQLGVQAVFARDYPILMGTILFSSILMVIGNLIADIAYAWVDPRVTLK